MTHSLGSCAHHLRQGAHVPATTIVQGTGLCDVCAVLDLGVSHTDLSEVLHKLNSSGSEERTGRAFWGA